MRAPRPLPSVGWMYGGHRRPRPRRAPAPVPAAGATLPAHDRLLITHLLWALPIRRQWCEPGPNRPYDTVPPSPENARLRTYKCGLI